MNKEEILEASRKQNTGMDERAHFNYQVAYMTGAAASIILASLLLIVEIIKGGNYLGYLVIILLQPTISGLFFGLKSRDTALGKLSLFSGTTCLIALIMNLIIYFMNL